MTKEQFEQLSKKEEIPIDIWYQYFIDKGGQNIGLEKFKNIFLQMIQQGQVIVTGTKGTPKFISLKSALDNFYTFYKEKFAI